MYHVDSEALSVVEPWPRIVRECASLVVRGAELPLECGMLDRCARLEWHVPAQQTVTERAVKQLREQAPAMTTLAELELHGVLRGLDKTQIHALANALGDCKHLKRLTLRDSDLVTYGP